MMRTAALRPNQSSEEIPELMDYSPTCFIVHSNFEFCGYSIKIARLLGSNRSISADVWESGIALCRYFEKEKISFTGKKVIELESGTGIVGILAALLGGDVTITEQPKTLEQIENNVSINIPFASRRRLKVSALTWGENHTDFPTDYDFILGADIVYNSITYPALIETLRHLADQGTTIYFSFQLRIMNSSAIFYEELLPLYFNCHIVDRLVDKDIIVYKITKINRLII